MAKDLDSKKELEKKEQDKEPPLKRKTRAGYTPLAFCPSCGEGMYVGTSGQDGDPESGKPYKKKSLRCENEECPYRVKMGKAYTSPHVRPTILAVSTKVGEWPVANGALHQAGGLDRVGVGRDE